MNKIRVILIKIVSAIGRLKNCFITFHRRPMYDSDLRLFGERNTEDALCAIVIQGPIRKEDNFTLETVKFYKRNYPATTVFLSTWTDEDISAFEVLKDKNFKIIQSVKPYPGSGNINLQIFSTKVAIDWAIRMGLTYILKTRTDERMYGTDSLKFMQNMLKCFPVLRSNNQHQRIITTNAGSTIHPYHFSDLFMFGEAFDMELYWSAELIMDRSFKPNKFFCEAYLFAEFMRSTGWDYRDTKEDYNAFLGDRCIILDNESVDVYWPKYTPYREYRIRNYNYPIEFTFKKWLNETYIPAIARRD